MSDGTTLKERCDHANAQLLLKDVNLKRKRMGLEPVHWAISHGRIAIRSGEVPLSTAGTSGQELL